MHGTSRHDALTSVDDAFAAIVAGVAAVEGTETVALEAAAGRIAAADIATALALPPFDPSAVDGFGIHAADTGEAPAGRLRVAGRIAAGSEPAGAGPGPGEALRVFTGAPVPPSVAGVVMEEHCRIAGDGVDVPLAVAAGANIRRRGEDVAAGATIVEGGTLLDARHVGLLAAAGVAAVTVRRRIRVAILSTGDELRPPGEALAPGTIHDSNRPMLAALVARPWIEPVASLHAEDRAERLAAMLRDLAADTDVILSSGGAAGSDTDHMEPAIRAAGGTATPFRLALKPGKPIVSGRLAGAAILALPGNPVAAMVNFLLFGRALLFARAGIRPARPRGQPAIAAAAIAHIRGRTEFAPARVVGYESDGRPRIEKLGRGGSARLRPLVLADGLIEVEAGSDDVPAGGRVAFHPFHGALVP